MKKQLVFCMFLWLYQATFVLSSWSTAADLSEEASTVTAMELDAASSQNDYCEFDVDVYNCVNVNCNGMRRLRKIPESLSDLINGSMRANEILCSIDFTDTGIVELTMETFEYFDLFLYTLIKANPNQSQTTLKLSFSNLHTIRRFQLPDYLNTVIFVRNSHLQHVQAKSMSLNDKLELNLANLNTSSLNWLHLLDSTKLKLLSLRNMLNLKSEFNILNKDLFDLAPVASINDVKIYNSYLPIIDDYFFLFKILKYIEQLEMNSCSISFIKSSIFDKYFSTFRSLKYLTLSNNNLNKISDYTFNGLSNLLMLDLDDNPIEFIQSNAFTHLKRLKYLSINSNHVKSINFNSNPAWFVNVLKLNKNMQEISFKTSKLLKHTCILSSLINFVNTYNLNVLQAAHNVTQQQQQQQQQILDTNNMARRYVRLFTQEQIEYPFHTVQYLSDVFCNVYLVCVQSMQLNASMLAYSRSGYATMNLWHLELFKSCPLIMNETLFQRCFIEKKTFECQKNSSIGSYEFFKLKKNNSIFNSK